MKFVSGRPRSPGEYLLYLENTIHKKKFYSHVRIDKDADFWFYASGPEDDIPCCYGPHIRFIGHAKVTCSLT